MNYYSDVEAELTDDEDIIPAYVKNCDEGDDGLSMKICTTALRYGVMVLFIKKYGGLQVEPRQDIQSKWTGRGGLISKIKKTLE